MDKLHARISRPTRTINWLVFTWHFNVSVHVNLTTLPLHPEGMASHDIYCTIQKSHTNIYSKQYTHQLLFVYRNKVYISGDAYTSYLSPVTSHSSMHRLKSTQFPTPCKANQQSMHSTHTHTHTQQETNSLDYIHCQINWLNFLSTLRKWGFLRTTTRPSISF